METIDHTTLMRLTEAGAVRSAHIVGQAGGWGILIKYGMAERALAAQRSQQVRIFRKFETLVGYLKGVGIVRFDVDAANYDPDSLKATRSRPDQTAALKSVYEAAARSKLLKAKVQLNEAGQEADVKTAKPKKTTKAKATAGQPG